MADAPKDSDQSMEDILQSIKRIIADEGEAPPADVVGSDVLELTELLAEDVAVPSTESGMDSVAAEVGTMSIDELMAAPISAMPQMDAAPIMPDPEPKHEPEPEPEPVFEAAQPAAAPVIAPDDQEKLISDATLAASAAALKALSHKPQPYSSHESPIFRSGTTVEDLVLESLKPMLREWLDGNLPALVRQLVDREIRRLSGM